MSASLSPLPFGSWLSWLKKQNISIEIFTNIIPDFGIMSTQA